MKTEIPILDVVKSYGIEVKKAGKDTYRALCPFHNDTLHPNLTLYPLKNTFKCFACGKFGNVAQFVIEKEHCTFEDAVKKLKRLEGINPSENRKPDRIHVYYDEKGASIYRKLIFKDGEDKKCHFERLEGNKWLTGLNGMSQVLYNLAVLKENSIIYLSESEKDVDKLNELGLSSVSSGGANNWHEEWKNLFINKDIVILPHNDKAGKKFADIVTDSLVEVAKSVKIINPITFGEKSGNDVADFIEERLQQGKNKGQIKIELLEIVENTPVHKLLSLLDKLQTSTDIINLDCRVEWIVEKLIPKGAITLLYGRGGIGKTWLLLQMGKAVAEGADFLNLETKKATIIYVDFENPMSVLKERLEILRISSGIYFWHLSNNNLTPPKLDEKKWELYKKLPKDSVLIFDTLRASQNGDENSSKDMANVMERLKILREAGYTIILLHHTPKRNEAIYKGSTAILDLVDHALCLEKTKNAEDLSLDSGVFRLGTKEKTRFELCEVHICFNPNKGFETTTSLQEEKCLELSELMQQMKEDGKDLIQKNIIEKTKKSLELGKNKILSLLEKGEGSYWNSAKQGKERFYTLINNSSIPTLYKYGKQGNDETSEEMEAGIDKGKKSLQPIDNKVISSIPDTPLETRKREDVEGEKCQMEKERVQA